MKSKVLNQRFAHYTALVSAVLVLAGSVARAASTTELSSAASADDAAKNKKTAALTAPVIRSFSVTPDVITTGGTAKLRWSATGATSVTITADNGSAPGTIAGSNVMVHPAGTTTYTITAVNAAGRTVKTVTVAVFEPAASLPVGLFTGPATSGLSQYRR